jgi:hypothetical protein
MSIINPTTMIASALAGAVVLASLAGVTLRDTALTLLGMPAGLFALVVAEHLRTR